MILMSCNLSGLYYLGIIHLVDLHQTYKQCRMKEVLGTHLSPTSRWASLTPYPLVAIFWPSTLFHTNRTSGKDKLYIVFMRLKDKASGEVPSSIWHVIIIGQSMCHHERGKISFNCPYFSVVIPSRCKFSISYHALVEETLISALRLLK